MAAGSTLNKAGSPPPESVRAELLTICRSTVFGSAPRLQKLLGYLVEENLAGNPLKEPIRIRWCAPKIRRLRAKLMEYSPRREAGTV